MKLRVLSFQRRYFGNDLATTLENFFYFITLGHEQWKTRWAWLIRHVRDRNHNSMRLKVSNYFDFDLPLATFPWTAHRSFQVVVFEKGNYGGFTNIIFSPNSRRLCIVEMKKINCSFIGISILVVSKITYVAQNKIGTLFSWREEKKLSVKS